MRSFLMATLVVCGAALGAAGSSLAAEPPKLGWVDAAALSYVVTGGNSEASTLGFRNDLAWTAERKRFTLKASGLRAESSSGPRRAVDQGGGDVTIIDPPTVLSVESYALGGKYAQNISQRVSWTGGAGWERNRFAGVDSRYSVSGGLGNIWYDRADLKFRSDYSVTWTDEKEVDQAGNSFMGLRLTVDLLRTIGESATYTHATIIDESLDDTGDLRADMTNALAVAINSRLALKVALQLLYDRQPAIEVLDVEDLLGVKTGATEPVELDDLDTIFTTSLVVNF